MEPRFGAFVAVAAALIAVTSGGAVAAAPLKRRRRAGLRLVTPASPGCAI